MSRQKKQTNKKPIEQPLIESEHFANLAQQDNNNDANDEKDSSIISDIDDNETMSDAFNYDEKKKSKNESGDNEDENSEEFIQNVVLERVIKYIKLDDLIKDKQAEHKKELKAIKDAKDQLEKFLIEYLDKIDEEYIKVGNKSTLVKTQTQTKAPPKMEDISMCLIDGFRKYEIYESDVEIKRVVQDFIQTIEEKREIRTRKYLKRTKGDTDKKESKIIKSNKNNKVSDTDNTNEKKQKSKK
jgi:hypothetical protein